MNQSPLALISDVMTRPVLSIAPDDSLQQAVHLMAEHAISCLVVGSGGKSLGIITETDVLRAMHRQLPGDTPASAIMIAPLLTATPDMDLVSARRFFEQHGIHHLVVVDPAGLTIGIVTDPDFHRHLGAGVFRHLRTLESAMDHQIAHLPPEASLAKAIDCMLTH